MKELSIEEKAKRYNEALEKARQLYAYPTTKPFISDLQDLFPELAESEDERIRKAIIEHFSRGKEVEFPELEEKYNTWIAWLEKLGKGDMGISEAAKQELENNLNKALEKETPESCNEFLEKQGESIKIKKGQYYLCTNTHKYAGLEWKEGIKYYSPEDYFLVNQGYICFSPKYSKEEHNNFFKEVELKKDGQKTAWSEEDKKGILNTIALIEGVKNSNPKDEYCVENCDYCLHWLKSIKDRVQLR